MTLVPANAPKMQGADGSLGVRGGPTLLSKRFLLKPLTEGDVTQRYLEWLRDGEARTYIVTAAATTALAELREYVRKRKNRSDVLFLGIFDKDTSVHVGNIKYEPVDSELGYAIMGMLIGDAAYRGKGVAGEVLNVTGAWLKARRGITQIVLGVDRNNAAAVRAYEKVGFVVAGTPYIPEPKDGSATMVWRL